MAAAVEKRVSGVPTRSSRVRRIGLFASSAATAALFVTYCSGNRYLGFGKSISETDQKALLIVAGLLIVGFGAVSLLSRWREARANVATTNLNQIVTESQGQRK